MTAPCVSKLVMIIYELFVLSQKCVSSSLLVVVLNMCMFVSIDAFIPCMVRACV